MEARVAEAEGRVVSGVLEPDCTGSKEPIVDFSGLLQTSVKLYKLTVKYILLKTKAINTQNSSLPNYLVMFYYYLCS